MLLDRRRINKWARWVALILAIVFAAGFLFMGVGYGGGAGFNLSELFTGGNKTPDAPQTPEEKIAAYQALLTANPNDAAALIGLATVYQESGDLVRTAAYLELALKADPAQKDLYMRLANLYMSQDVGNYAAAVAVLNKATEVDVSNPDVYLKLGSAQKALGNTQAAILAWQKFLDLAPNSDMATTVRGEIEKLSQPPTTTSTTATTTP